MATAATTKKSTGSATACVAPPVENFSKGMFVDLFLHSDSHDVTGVQELSLRSSHPDHNSLARSAVRQLICFHGVDKPLNAVLAWLE